MKQDKEILVEPNEVKELLDAIDSKPKVQPAAKPNNGEDAEEASSDAPPITGISMSSGKLCQYVNNENGYVPTGPTLKKLPSGCYIIRYINNVVSLVLNDIVTDKLITFPDTKSSMILDEIDKFLSYANNFKKYGFSHKRGYLLYGPQGGGKTATVNLVTQKIIEQDGIIIYADKPALAGDILKDIRSVEPDRLILVIWEDIDEVVNQYGYERVTSILDGEFQINKIVFIATTNNPQDLDRKLIDRPSRFDRIVKIDYPCEETRKLFLKEKLGFTVYKGFDLVKETENLSIAHLKELIVTVFCLDGDVLTCISRLKNMKIIPKNNGNGHKAGFN